ncbi:putative LisH domain-containing protein [Glarea lozoyensis 74030]|uniref:Putative LisH domain-containing protein n=1 Tax=Glarea lozoyensis (strain ATCC 74030 / MF5533) TaxID=1104152 RepID=H0EN13_GLAL7|nr:putative LisH domain-containing protein [Glarea lozoyensis 74030]
MAYVNHTQNQSRQRQEQQAQVLRNMRNDVAPQNYQQMMMRPGPNGMSLQQQELRKNAIMANRQQNITPQHAQMLAQQQKANQMQRVPSDGNNQRPQSPGSAENAPSPSKKPRLDAAAFNPQQGMPNGRGQMQGMPQQQVGDTGPSNAIQAAHMQLANGIEPNNLTGQQFQVPGGANPAQQARLAGYQAGLAQQQAGQMPNKPMPNQGGPPNQGSPMMAQGPADGNLANYYNPTDMGANGMRGPAGAQGAGTGNHALQDYQMQLMLLEQQNKKRLMMARQEQDSMTLPRGADGAPGAQPMGPNGQPFQGASPGARNSPNPTDAIKRTPHMNPGSIPSPIPDGQNRGSPGSMNFNNMPGNPMDPNNMNPKFYQMNGGMDPNMVAANMQNGMRPPSSHPGGFNPLAQQQMQMQQAQRQQVAVAQQQAQQQQANGQNWVGPNGQQMVSQPSQGAPQQNIGTPRQQNQMPPPSAPAGAVANGRTQPSSPQSVAAPPTPNQANKANPKKKPDAKDTKAKRATKKGSAANLNAGATPSADAPTDGPTPTPQTPITPSHNKFGGQNGAVQPPTNGQPPAPPANPGLAVAQQQPEQMPNFGGMNDYVSWILDD